MFLVFTFSPSSPSSTLLTQQGRHILIFILLINNTYQLINASLLLFQQHRSKNFCPRQSQSSTTYTSFDPNHFATGHKTNNEANYCVETVRNVVVMCLISLVGLRQWLLCPPATPALQLAVCSVDISGCPLGAQVRILQPTIVLPSFSVPLSLFCATRFRNFCFEEILSRIVSKKTML